jgi:hypothetical protein
MMQNIEEFFKVKPWGEGGKASFGTIYSLLACRPLSLPFPHVPLRDYLGGPNHRNMSIPIVGLNF